MAPLVTCEVCSDREDMRVLLEQLLHRPTLSDRWDYLVECWAPGVEGDAAMLQHNADFDRRVRLLREDVEGATRLYEFQRIWASTEGAGVRVAVLDNGVDRTHPALADAVVEHASFLERPHVVDPAGVTRRAHHGTHCAGIIAARPLPRDGTYGPVAELIPVRGVAPRAAILDACCLHPDGFGYMDEVAAAIYWALNKKAHVISMSIQSRASDPALYEAVYTALRRGCIVICAAGNYGKLYRKNVGYPGRYGGVITIAAHDRSGVPVSFSASGGEIDFSAPGEGIWSTIPAGYGRYSGTSMAAPFVAGIAALLLAKHHQADQRRDEIIAALRSIDEKVGGSILGELRAAGLATNGIDAGVVQWLFDFDVAESELTARWQRLRAVVHPLGTGLSRRLMALRRDPLGRAPYNDTPILNTEDFKDHLLAMAANPGAHDRFAGYGPLWPASYFRSRPSILDT